LIRSKAPIGMKCSTLLLGLTSCVHSNVMAAQGALASAMTAGDRLVLKVDWQMQVFNHGTASILQNMVESVAQDKQCDAFMNGVLLHNAMYYVTLMTKEIYTSMLSIDWSFLGREVDLELRSIASEEATHDLLAIQDLFTLGYTHSSHPPRALGKLRDVIERTAANHGVHCTVLALSYFHESYNKPVPDKLQEAYNVMIRNTTHHLGLATDAVNFLATHQMFDLASPNSHSKFLERVLKAAASYDVALADCIAEHVSMLVPHYIEALSTYFYDPETPRALPSDGRHVKAISTKHDPNRDDKFQEHFLDLGIKQRAQQEMVVGSDHLQCSKVPDVNKSVVGTPIT